MIEVVLSGSDGAAGLDTIKRAGGLTVVLDPDIAGFDSLAVARNADRQSCGTAEQFGQAAAAVADMDDE